MQNISADTALENRSTISNQHTPAAPSQGQLHFSGNIRSLNPVQQESIRKLQRIAEVTGASITVQDMGSGRRLSGKNGYYDPADGSIHIDLRAGSNGTGTLLYTACHEFVHRMRQNNPEGFQRLSDFLLSDKKKTARITRHPGETSQRLIQAAFR